jgi:hypothetical protein
MLKVLSFMGLKYKDLYDVKERSAILRQQLYKENTHVFGYYILSAIFLSDYKQFICVSASAAGLTSAAGPAGPYAAGPASAAGPAGPYAAGPYMKFHSTEDNFKKLGNYIISLHNNKEFLKIIDVVEKMAVKSNELLLTLRMALTDACH